MSKFSSQPVYILDGVRTVFGRRFGALKRYTAVELFVETVEALMKRSRISKPSVDEVIFGSAIAAGLGQNPARQAAVAAGLSPQTTAFTVNTVCGSGLHAVTLAAQSILLDPGRVVVAGGSGSASHNPLLAKRPAEDLKVEDLQDSLLIDGLTCTITGKKMGTIMEASIRKYAISRERQDALALGSHQKAYQAYQKRLDVGEAVMLSTRSKHPDMDESIRKTISASSLAGLKTVYENSGTLTAGNACASCDGAAALILVGADVLRKYQIRPLARILGQSHVALDPELTFEAPLEAIKECLRQSGVSLSSIDLFEIAESFAASVVLVQDQLKIPEAKVNIWGGDLAIGHPLGAAGARVLVTLIKALQAQQLKRGLCVIPYGGGGAIAMLVDNVSLDPAARF